MYIWRQDDVLYLFEISLRVFSNITHTYRHSFKGICWTIKRVFEISYYHHIKGFQQYYIVIALKEYVGQ